MSANDTTRKKTLTRCSPEKIAELILEGERKGSSAEICRREGINSQQSSRWKSKAKEAMIQVLKEIKRGSKSKESNAEVESLTAEVEKLRATLCKDYYVDEAEAKRRIAAVIHDYCFNRPNMGVHEDEEMDPAVRAAAEKDFTDVKN